MNNPLVSILIPVYNTEKYVAETIESALYQTYKNIEIIIVDDGSTDRSWEIIEEYRKRYPVRIKAFRQENKGACAARNKAFSESRGDYIQWLDSDDILDINKIEAQMFYYKSGIDPNILFCGPFGVFKRNIRKAKFTPNKLWQDLLPVDWLIIYLNEVMMTTNASWLIHRKLVSKAGLWDESLIRNQDGEYIFRTVANSHFIKFIDNALFYYRKDNHLSISKNSSVKAIDSIYLSIVKCINILLEFEKSQRAFEAIQHILKVFISRHFYSNAPSISEAINLLNSFGVEFTKPEEKIIFKIFKVILGVENTLKLKSAFSKFKDLFVYK